MRSPNTAQAEGSPEQGLSRVPAAMGRTPGKLGPSVETIFLHYFWAEVKNTGRGSHHEGAEGEVVGQPEESATRGTFTGVDASSSEAAQS